MLFYIFKLRNNYAPEAFVVLMTQDVQELQIIAQIYTHNHLNSLKKLTNQFFFIFIHSNKFQMA